MDNITGAKTLWFDVPLFEVLKRCMHGADAEVLEAACDCMWKFLDKVEPQNPDKRVQSLRVPQVLELCTRSVMFQSNTEADRTVPLLLRQVAACVDWLGMEALVFMKDILRVLDFAMEAASIRKCAAVVDLVAALCRNFWFRLHDHEAHLVGALQTIVCTVCPREEQRLQLEASLEEGRSVKSIQRDMDDLRSLHVHAVEAMEGVRLIVSTTVEQTSRANRSTLSITDAETPPS